MCRIIAKSIKVNTNIPNCNKLRTALQAHHVGFILIQKASNSHSDKEHSSLFPSQLEFCTTHKSKRIDNRQSVAPDTKTPQCSIHFLIMVPSVLHQLLYVHFTFSRLGNWQISVIISKSSDLNMHKNLISMLLKKRQSKNKLSNHPHTLL